ncbi:hypothetical protein BOX15_Mlig029627g1, partial [Macrostomum lignano]
SINSSISFNQKRISIAMNYLLGLSAGSSALDPAIAATNIGNNNTTNNNSIGSSNGSGSRNRSKSRARCCVAGCNRREGDPGYSFHRFPTDMALREKWIAVMNQPGFHPGQSTRICSRHFVRSDFVAKQTEEEEAAANAAIAALSTPPGSPTSTPTPMPTPNRRRRLYPNAVPSVFRGRRVQPPTRSSTSSGVSLANPVIAYQQGALPAFALPNNGLQLAPLTLCYSQQQQQQPTTSASSVGDDTNTGDAEADRLSEQDNEPAVECKVLNRLLDQDDEDEMLPDVCSIVDKTAAAAAAAAAATATADSAASASSSSNRRRSNDKSDKANDAEARDLRLISQIVRVALDLDDSQSRLIRELGRLARRQRQQETRLGELVDELTKIVDGATSAS